MRRSRWNASISSKTPRKPSGGSTSSTRCGKSRSVVRRMFSRLRPRVILPNPPRPRASPLVPPDSCSLTQCFGFSDGADEDLQGYDANFGALLDELYPFRVIRLPYNILVATRPSAVFPSLDRVGS